MRQQQALAEELFYAMKSLDVDIANVERVVEASGNPKNQDQVEAISSGGVNSRTATTSSCPASSSTAGT